MAVDPRKRQKKLERKKAKDKGAAQGPGRTAGDLRNPTL